jgi:hypothetical protein
MIARIPLLVIITASAFFAIAIANSAAADETKSNPQAICKKQRAACHKACYDAYDKWISGSPTPAQVPKHKKELKECYKSCLTEPCGTRAP